MQETPFCDPEVAAETRGGGSITGTSSRLKQSHDCLAFLRWGNLAKSYKHGILCLKSTSETVSLMPLSL